MTKLWDVSHVCTDLHNAGNEQRNTWGRQHAINIFQQKKELPALKKAFPELKRPCSQVLQEVVYLLDQSWKSYFGHRKNGNKAARPPRYKSKKYFFTQTYPQEGTSFKLTGETLLLAYGKKPSDWISIPFPGGVPGQPKTAQILLDNKSKEWFVCVTYEIADAPEFSKGHAIYFDPGCKTALTGIKTDGAFFEYDISWLRKLNMESYKQIDDMMSRRDKCEKGSRQHRMFQRKIDETFSKIRTRTKAHLHALGNRILNDHWDVTHFFIGDWKKQDTLANTGNDFANAAINRAVQNNNPIGALVDYLRYKAKRRGKHVEKFDERGSTRTCVICKHKLPGGLDPSERTFCCPKCNFTYPRDKHSCLNFVSWKEAALWQRMCAEVVSDVAHITIRTSLTVFGCKPKRVVDGNLALQDQAAPATRAILQRDARHFICR